MQLKIVIVDNKNKVLTEFTQEELEKLLRAGYSVKDIIKQLKQKTHGK